MAGYKRNRGGDKWELCVTLGTDFTGKRKRFSKTVHCSSERAADKELARFFSQCEEGFYNASAPCTVEDLCLSYMENYAERFHKKSSLRSDNTAINIWIVPLLGRRKITTLKKLDIQQWVNKISDSGKSPKTVRNYFSVLRSVLDYAIDMELIGSNPCENVRLPKKEQHEMKAYQSDELAALVVALDSLPEHELRYRCAISLALWGGFRKGEVLGFNWDDIDFDALTVHVCRTRMIAPGVGIYEDTPKTNKSVRDVVLPAFIFDDLKRLKTQQMEDQLKFGQYYSDSPAVIRADDGDPLYPQVLQRWFTRFCKRNDLPCYGLHALRHTHASLLASIGANQLLISNRLGHSQVSTTLDIYTHLIENVDTSIADQLADYKDRMSK